MIVCCIVPVMMSLFGLSWFMNGCAWEIASRAPWYSAVSIFVPVTPIGLSCIPCVNWSRVVVGIITFRVWSGMGAIWRRTLE